MDWKLPIGRRIITEGLQKMGGQHRMVEKEGTEEEDLTWLVHLSELLREETVHLLLTTR